MIRPFFLVMLFLALRCSSQPAPVSIANAHSHNDYEQASPFWAAWKEGFGSIEADIFLDDGKLIVAHDKKELANNRTLDSLYLQPLKQCIDKNKGFVYADKNRQLQLMIDIKTEAVPTLEKLVEELKRYPSLTGNSSLVIVISGNRPDPPTFHHWPQWIHFDGLFQRDYTSGELVKIKMMSDNFAKYSAWKGEGEMPAQDQQVIDSLVRKSHELGKKIRFWNAPDNSAAWALFLKLGVDFINTDKISELGSFLKSREKSSQ